LKVESQAFEDFKPSAINFQLLKTAGPFSRKAQEIVINRPYQD
jgi:hypothetical protein